MMRSRLLLTIALVGFVAPLTGMAQSYMSPEDVLQQNNNAFLVPSHQRGAQWAVEMEAQLSRERHPSIIREPWDIVQDDGLPPPIAIDEQFYPDQPIDPMPAYQQPSGIDPLTARLLARLAQQNSILTSTMPSTAGYNNAPLAQTGPAAVLVVIAMAIATVVTLRKARVLERFV